MNNLLSNFRNNGKLCLFCDAVYLTTAVTLPIALPFIIIAMTVSQ
jgi:hypothetical protein